MTATLDDEGADLRRVNAELQQKLGERTKERDEALQRETATADILRVINSSAGDAQPTLDAIAASATRLCGAASGAIIVRFQPVRSPKRTRSRLDALDETVIGSHASRLKAGAD